MSGEVISMDDFRKSQALVDAGSETDVDDSMAEASAVLHKFLMGALHESRKKNIPLMVMSMVLFTEGASALVANDWEIEEIVQWLRELEGNGFFEYDDEDDDEGE